MLGGHNSLSDCYGWIKEQADNYLWTVLTYLLKIEMAGYSGDLNNSVHITCPHDGCVDEAKIIFMVMVTVKKHDVESYNYIATAQCINS